ncbi:hypothetical protein, partial [Mesorhizobium sp. M7A.F.Ca.US.001.04.2.1]|uniref:hypothetical protein n=1 Tax=Mesorhizobium sp. M7A.F.Ca.US.001.04.2.1 TaxID=2496727 RepID=UPI0019D1B415
PLKVEGLPEQCVICLRARHWFRGRLHDFLLRDFGASRALEMLGPGWWQSIAHGVWLTKRATGIQRSDLPRGNVH